MSRCGPEQGGIIPDRQAQPLAGPRMRSEGKQEIRSSLHRPVQVFIFRQLTGNVPSYPSPPGRTPTKLVKCGVVGTMAAGYGLGPLEARPEAEGTRP